MKHPCPPPAGDRGPATADGRPPIRNLLLLALAALLGAGCSAGQRQPRGGPDRLWLIRAFLTDLKESDVQGALNAKPAFPSPARVALVASPPFLPLAASELRPAVEKLTKALAGIPGVTPAGDLNLDLLEPPSGPRSFRLLAASRGDHVVLFIAYNEGHEVNDTFFSFLNILIVPGLTLPLHRVAVDAEVRLAAVDVVTGRVLYEWRGEAKKDSRSRLAGVQGNVEWLHGELVEELFSRAAEALAKDFGAALAPHRETP